MRKVLYACVLATLGFGTAGAQTVGTEVQRNVDQQARIEQGLKSGALDTREAARLERGEAHVDRMQSRALSDGTLSPGEAARIRKAQNVESARIYGQKHDAQTGHPGSASSRRMQADVGRNIAQQKRIGQGVASGSLTSSEAASLERGQARVDRKEARAGANGRVGAIEQAGVQRAENVQSARIYREKHD